MQPVSTPMSILTIPVESGKFLCNGKQLSLKTPRFPADGPQQSQVSLLASFFTNPTIFSDHALTSASPHQVDPKTYGTEAILPRGSHPPASPNPSPTPHVVTKPYPSWTQLQLHRCSCSSLSILLFSRSP